MSKAIKEFLEKYGTRVSSREPLHYVELMMDNHKCVKYGRSQYYIPEDTAYTEEEEEIFDYLVENEPLKT